MAVKPDPSPEVGANVKAELANIANGRINAALYTPEFAAQLTPTLPQQKAGIAPLGPVQNVEYVGDSRQGLERVAYYRVKFRDVTLYAIVCLTRDGRIRLWGITPNTTIEG